MKTTLALSLSLLALIPAKSLAGSDTARGALIGGLAGAIIGASTGDRHDAIAGAAIGATAGAIIGSTSHDSHRHYAPHGRSHVSVSYGFGYGHGYGYRPYYSYHHRPYYRHAHRGWGYYPTFHYTYTRPVYYSSSYEVARPVQVVTAPEVQTAAPVQTTQPAQTAPQNVTIINNYYGGSSMGQANSMFGR